MLTVSIKSMLLDKVQLLTAPVRCPLPDSLEQVVTGWWWMGGWRRGGAALTAMTAKWQRVKPSSVNPLQSWLDVWVTDACRNTGTWPGPQIRSVLNFTSVWFVDFIHFHNISYDFISKLKLISGCSDHLMFALLFILSLLVSICHWWEKGGGDTWLTAEPCS